MKPASPHLASIALVAFLPTAALAETPVEPDDADDIADAETPTTTDAPEATEPRNPDTVIREKRRTMFKTAGSISLIDEETLEATEYDDPHAILAEVPGVYARTEDGYGLRPNIGIRGVSSERSQKLTLMEDGILFAPAPYSAPAAYYFPMMTRMIGLEVLKGPAAIMYGPNTIGGAIDLQTRRVPRDFEGALDLSLGTAAAFDHLTGKVHAHLGQSWARGGLLAEVVHLDSGGFKQLDAPSEDRADTGFSRTEAMLKGNLFSDRYGVSAHRLDLKLSFSRESSNETYLGLTDADFEENPWRRYAASALDHIEWNRFALALAHTFTHDATDLRTTAYTQRFDRTWKKLGKFRDGPSLGAILADPDNPLNVPFMRILEGLDDSTEPGHALVLGNQAREYSIYGLESVVGHRARSGDFRHKVDLGMRLHADGVDRLHKDEAHVMRAGVLVPDESPVTTVDNASSALALASWLTYAASGDGWTFTPGLRFEWITTSLTDSRTDVSEIKTSDTVLLPGLGIHREIVPDFGIFAGVYRGFSPVAPGQSDEISPETSFNWEAGFRWLDPDLGSLAELVGFWNDYDNLIGTCTLASGCDEANVDRQYNAGAVTVLGLEAALGHRFALGGGFELPVKIAYTFTHATFDTDFTSENPQFGEVEAGDFLPYVPDHQVSVQVGLSHHKGRLLATFSYFGEMLESAGPRNASDVLVTDAIHTLDLFGGLDVGVGLEVYLRGENLLMEEAVGSRRPLGARPARPVSTQLGLKWRFGQARD